MVLDVFSRYAWIVPLKDKKGESVAEAFKTSLREVENHNIYGQTKVKNIITNT